MASTYRVIDGRRPEVGDTVLVFDELATVVSLNIGSHGDKATVRHEITGEQLEVWFDEIEVVERD